MVLHSLFRKISHKPPYQQLLIIQPQMTTAPKLRVAPPPHASQQPHPASVLLNQAEGELKNKHLLTKTRIQQLLLVILYSQKLLTCPRIKSRYKEVLGNKSEVFLLPRKQLLHFNAMIIFLVKLYITDYFSYN